VTMCFFESVAYDTSFSLNGLWNRDIAVNIESLSH